MAMVGEMTLSDYENIKRLHPDLVIGEDTDHPITLARVCMACEGQGLIDPATPGYSGLRLPGCAACNGFGYAITPDGEALLRLFHLFATGGRA